MGRHPDAGSVRLPPARRCQAPDRDKRSGRSDNSWLLDEGRQRANIPPRAARHRERGQVHGGERRTRVRDRDDAVGVRPRSRRRSSHPAGRLQRPFGHGRPARHPGRCHARSDREQGADSIVHVHPEPCQAQPGDAVQRVVLHRHRRDHRQVRMGLRRQRHLRDDDHLADDLEDVHERADRRRPPARHRQRRRHRLHHPHRAGDRQPAADGRDDRRAEPRRRRSDRDVQRLRLDRP